MAMMAMVLLSSCVIEDGSPDLNVKEQSKSKVLFLKSASCSRSAAAEKYFRTSFDTWKEELELPSNAKLENYVEFIELDEGAPGFNMNKAKDYFKSAKYYYNLGKDGSAVSTPIICFGEKYICGWDYQSEAKVNVWIKSYLEKSKSDW